MIKRISILVVVIFFAAGTVAALAGDGSCTGKNALQSAYDWMAGGYKSCSKTTAETRCKSCSKACCQTCQTGCGGNCCAACGKK